MEIIKPLHDQCSSHIEISQLICHADQLTGFYMIRKLVDFLKASREKREGLFPDQIIFET